MRSAVIIFAVLLMLILIPGKRTHDIEKNINNKIHHVQTTPTASRAR